jgi:hypothetical protein
MKNAGIVCCRFQAYFRRLEDIREEFIPVSRRSPETIEGFLQMPVRAISGERTTKGWFDYGKFIRWE